MKHEIKKILLVKNNVKVYFEIEYIIYENDLLSIILKDDIIEFKKDEIEYYDFVSDHLEISIKNHIKIHLKNYLEICF